MNNSNQQLKQRPELVETGRNVLIHGQKRYILRLADVPDSDGVLRLHHTIVGEEYMDFACQSALLELAGVDLEVDGDFNGRLVLGLKAEDVTLRGVKAETLGLTGSYKRFTITDSPETRDLQLQSATFDELDLSQTRLSHVEIDLRSVEPGRISLPASVQTVVISSNAFGLIQKSTSLEKMSLTEIESALAAWNSPGLRLSVARRLLGNVPRLSAQRMQQWLNSKSASASGVLNRKSQVHGPLAMAALLIAHNNRPSWLTAANP